MSITRFYNGRSKTLGHLPAKPDGTEDNSNFGNSNLENFSDSKNLKVSECCQKCGSLHQWQAKQSTGAVSARSPSSGQVEPAIERSVVPFTVSAVEPPWLCWHCEPPPIKSLVARRRGPLAEALVTKVDSKRVQVMEAIQSESERLLKPIVIAMESPICPICSGMFVIESNMGDSLNYSCWTCQTEISGEIFQDCFSNPSKFWKLWKESAKETQQDVT